MCTANFSNHIKVVSYSLSLNRELTFGLWMTSSFPCTVVTSLVRHLEVYFTDNMCGRRGTGGLHSQLVERRSGDRLLLPLNACNR